VIGAFEAAVNPVSPIRKNARAAVERSAGQKVLLHDLSTPEEKAAQIA
jgi:hypothetical protein